MRQRTSFAVGSCESERAVTLEGIGAEQTTRATITTRVHTTDRRALVLAFRYVLT